MWYLFLDESGDLGFDFVNKRPTRFFTICILATSDPESFYAIRRAAKKTLRRKVNRGGKSKKRREELKGAEITLEAKKHFFLQIKDLKFGIFALTLNKKQVFQKLTQEKERVYNYIARLVMDKIPFEDAKNHVQLYVDRSKARNEIRDFNNYIIRHLQARLNPEVTLNIDHITSHSEPAMQAVDLFAWGILRKYERNETTWYDCFSGKVRFDEVFLGRGNL